MGGGGRGLDRSSHPTHLNRKLPSPSTLRVKGLPCVARQELILSCWHESNLSQGYTPFPVTSQVPRPTQEASRAWVPGSPTPGPAHQGGPWGPLNYHLEKVSVQSYRLLRIFPLLLLLPRTLSSAEYSSAGQASTSFGLPESKWTTTFCFTAWQFYIYL